MISVIISMERIERALMRELAGAASCPVIGIANDRGGIFAFLLTVFVRL
jgi:hypothetical protein